MKSPPIIEFFLRYDWFLDSIYFITNPTLIEKVVFPNLMRMDKKILILEFKSLVT